MLRNLLFDLGGVIMDIKRDNCVAAFHRLGMDHPEDLLDEYTQKGPFLKVENGEWSADRFRQELRRYIPHPVTDSQIDEAFSEFLVGIPQQRLHQLEDLRKRYGIYLLSNTNPIMWNGRIAADFRQLGKEAADYFDGIITSFEAHAVKPDKEIFLKAIEKFGIDPTETLFLDDSQHNLDSAATLGFMTALVVPGTEFIDFIP